MPQGPLDSISSSYAVNAAHQQNLRLDTGSFVSSFSQYTFAQPGLPSAARGASYEYGEAVAMYPTATAQCVAPSQQFQALPAADVSGGCSDMSYQAFGVNSGPSFCTVRAAAGRTLEDACTAIFSVAKYLGTSNTTAGTTKTPCMASTPAADVAVPVIWVVRGHKSTDDENPHDWTPANTTLPQTSYSGGVRVNPLLKYPC